MNILLIIMSISLLVGALAAVGLMAYFLIDIALKIPEKLHKNAVISIETGEYKTVPHLEISSNDMPWGMYHLGVDVSIKTREGNLEVLKINEKPLAYEQKIHGTRGDRTTHHVIFDLNEKEIEEFFGKILERNIPYYYTVSVTSVKHDDVLIIDSNCFTMSTIVPSDSKVKVVVKKSEEWEA